MRHAQLRAFHGVAQWGGFSKAAERLGLSQPAVSDHVRKLEEAYGVQLFRRASRRVELTDLGRRLYAVTERQFEAEAQALELLSRAQGLEEGLLTIGADAAVHILPLMTRFQERYPRMRLRLVGGNSAQLMARVEAFEIDFAVIADLPSSPLFTSRLLREDKLVAFVARKHQWGRRRSVSFEELAGASLILREHGSATRWLFEAELARRNIAPRNYVEIEGREAAREAVVQGLGVGIVSKGEYVPDERLHLIPIADWQATMQEWLVCLTSRAELQMLKALLQLVDGE